MRLCETTVIVRNIISECRNFRKCNSSAAHLISVGVVLHWTHNDGVVKYPFHASVGKFHIGAHYNNNRRMLLLNI